MNQSLANSYALQPKVLAALGIDKQPFSAADIDVLYSDDELAHQLELIAHNLEYSGLVQICYGVPGSGKTTLLVQLLAKIGTHMEAFIAKADRDLTADKIINDMLVAVEKVALDSPLQSLIDELDNRLEADQILALVVDDAQTLADEQLKQLLLQINEINRQLNGRMRLLLTATPEFSATLAALPVELLATDQIASHTLPAFSEQQTVAYLQHRFQQLGAELPLSAEELSDIHAMAAGIPAAIHAQTCALLNESYAMPTPNTQPPASRNPILVGGAIVGGLIAIVLTLLLAGGHDTETETPHLQSLAIPLPTESANPDDDLEPAEPLVTAQTELDAEPVAPAEPMPIAMPAATPAEPVALPVSEPQSTQTVATATPPKPVETAAATNKPLSSKPIATTTASKPTPPAQKPVAVNDLPPKVKNQTWLQTQADGKYVIQLMAVSQREALYDFITRNNINQSTAVFATKHDGSPWYVAVYGLYADADHARAAIPKLPAALRNNSPWIRSVGSIKQAVKNLTP